MNDWFYIDEEIEATVSEIISSDKIILTTNVNNVFKILYCNLFKVKRCEDNNLICKTLKKDLENMLPIDSKVKVKFFNDRRNNGSKKCYLVTVFKPGETDSINDTLNRNKILHESKSINELNKEYLIKNNQYNG